MTAWGATSSEFIVLCQQSLDKLVRLKILDLIRLFAGADELDWDAKLVRDGDDDSTARRAVELCQNDTRYRHGFLENLGLRDGILAGGGVEHEQGLIGGPAQLT